MYRSRQQGLGLLAIIAAILAGIALLLILLAYSAAQTAKATTCQTNLVTLQTQYQNWLAACKSGDTVSANALSTQMNTLIAQWNAGQCATYATLPAQPTACPQ